LEEDENPNYIEHKVSLFFIVLGIKLRASCMSNMQSTTKPQPYTCPNINIFLILKNQSQLYLVAPEKLQHGTQETILNCKHLSQVLVAHACNSTYSEGRDQEDHSSRSVWANSSLDPMLKIPNKKMGWLSGSKGRVPAY
jgi:hypothetical protein